MGANQHVTGQLVPAARRIAQGQGGRESGDAAVGIGDQAHLRRARAHAAELADDAQSRRRASATPAAGARDDDRDEIRLAVRLAHRFHVDLANAATLQEIGHQGPAGLRRV